VCMCVCVYVRMFMQIVEHVCVLYTGLETVLTLGVCVCVCVCDDFDITGGAPL
jgi:hypothetical protein